MKAFPHSFERVPDHPCFSESEGMDLRDYFAAKAMQSIILATAHKKPSLGFGTQSYVLSGNQVIAEIAYQAADAMMEARKK